MKRALLASVSVLALTHSSIAADIPAAMPVKAAVAPAPWTWTGFYIGINGGGIWHKAEALASEGFNGPHVVSVVKEASATFGGQVGANWQIQKFILGVEADWNWADAGGTSSFQFLPINPYSSNISSLATVRGRLGMAFSPTMIYATGGFAAGRVSNWVPTIFGGYPYEEKVRKGWTAGGGIEHGFTRNWTAKAEALYVDLGSSTVQGFVIAPGYVSTFKNTAVLGRLGLNYKW